MFVYQNPDHFCFFNFFKIFFEGEKLKDVGILSDLAAINPGYGDSDFKILLRSGRTALRIIYGGIYLVLLDFDHHSCPCRHLDGKLKFIVLNF